MRLFAAFALLCLPIYGQSIRGGGGSGGGDTTVSISGSRAQSVAVGGETSVLITHNLGTASTFEWCVLSSGATFEHGGFTRNSNDAGTFAFSPAAPAGSTCWVQAAGLGSASSAVTIGNLPSAAANANVIYLVSDAASTGDCTVGGGTTQGLCISNGSAWVSMGDGVGGGGASTIDQRTVTAATDTMLNADCGKLIIYNRATAIAVTLPQAGGAGEFADACTIRAKSIGAGDVTITPTTSTISGAASIVLSTGESGLINSDGTNYEALTNRLIAGAGVALAKTRTGTTPSGDTAVMLSRATHQAGTDLTCVPATASGTVYTCGVTPALTAYTTGQQFSFVPDVACGTAPTLNIDGVGAINLQKLTSGALANLAANDCRANVPYVITKAASAFVLIPEAANGTNMVTAAGTLTADLPMLGDGVKTAKVGTKTGTGNEFVTSQSPTLVTPVLGAATATTINGATVPAVADTLMGRATTDTQTNKTIDAEGTGNVVTIPTKIYLEAAGCQGATAALMWDHQATGQPAAGCFGTNRVKGVADFDAAADEAMHRNMALPGDFTGTVDVRLFALAAATTGTARVGVRIDCFATTEDSDGAVTNSTTFNFTPNGTTNRLVVTSQSTITITGCAAGELARVDFFRDADGTSGTDDMAGDLRVLGLEITFRRAM